MMQFVRLHRMPAALLGGALAALALSSPAKADQPDPNFALAASLLGQIISASVAHPQTAQATPAASQAAAPQANTARVAAQPNEVEEAAWSTTAQAHNGEVGARFPYHCPAHGMAYSIYGTGIYTDASAVCTAAVHAGLIGFARGGVVTIEMRPGQNDYTSSHHNGVSSLHWGSWNSSFVFVTPGN